MTNDLVPTQIHRALEGGGRPAQPSFPQRLRHLLPVSEEDDNGFLALGIPLQLPAGDRATAQEALLPYEAFLAAGNSTDIMFRLTIMLEHFYVRDIDDDTKAALMFDWIRMIDKYPLWAVQLACDGWLEMNERRPTIANIVQSCETHIRRARFEHHVLQRIAAAPTLPEEDQPRAE